MDVILFVASQYYIFMAVPSFNKFSIDEHVVFLSILKTLKKYLSDYTNTLPKNTQNFYQILIK